MIIIVIIAVRVPPQSPPRGPRQALRLVTTEGQPVTDWQPVTQRDEVAA